MAPLPICYLSGEYLPLAAARVSPLDRSFLYGDGVYEVVPVFDGRPFRFREHIERLDRSLREIRLAPPLSIKQWAEIFSQLIERNGAGDQYVYAQVSRGAENGRNHAPLPEVPRTIFGFCAPLPRPSAAQLRDGLACVTAEDTRWSRCDIKSVSLLANVLARQLAVDAGAHETILLRDGWLTDASASAVHVIIDNVIVTPPQSNRLLPGTTRSVVEELASEIGSSATARPISERQLRAAQEIWLSAATRNVSAVTLLDGQPVGNGRPGPLWQRMSRAFADLQRRLAGTPWQ